MTTGLLESPLAAQLDIVYQRLVSMMRAQGVDCCEDLVASSGRVDSVRR